MTKISHADWGLVEGVYGQLSSILRDERADYIPDIIPGFLAQALGRMSAYYDGHEMQMADDLRSVLGEIEGLHMPEADQFRWLYADRRLERFSYYGPQASGRRRPGPFESAVETCRRLRDLNALRKALSTTSLHAVLGGSVSYGRFLNVAGAESGNASDIDLVIIVSDYTHLSALISSLSAVDGVDRADLSHMQERSNTFGTIGRSLTLPCSFSHKVGLWGTVADPWLNPYEIPGFYKISLHVFSLADFLYLILEDVPVLGGQGEEFQRMMFDYRTDQPDHRLDHQRSFAGTSLFLERPFEQSELGFVAQSRACVILNDRYYPGMFQNLVLPQFEIRWENQIEPLHVKLSGFRWKIVERLRKERQARPYELLRLSLSHTRSFVFAPHIVRSVDGL